MGKKLPRWCSLKLRFWDQSPQNRSGRGTAVRSSRERGILLECLYIRGCGRNKEKLQEIHSLIYSTCASGSCQKRILRSRVGLIFPAFYLSKPQDAQLQGWRFGLRFPLIRWSKSCTTQMWDSRPRLSLGVVCGWVSPKWEPLKIHPGKAPAFLRKMDHNTATRIDLSRHTHFHYRAFQKTPTSDCMT